MSGSRGRRGVRGPRTAEDRQYHLPAGVGGCGRRSARGLSLRRVRRRDVSADEALGEARVAAAAWRAGGDRCPAGCLPRVQALRARAPAGRVAGEDGCSGVAARGRRGAPVHGRDGVGGRTPVRRDARDSPELGAGPSRAVPGPAGAHASPGAPCKRGDTHDRAAGALHRGRRRGRAHGAGRIDAVRRGPEAQRRRGAARGAAPAARADEEPGRRAWSRRRRRGSVPASGALVPGPLERDVHCQGLEALRPGPMRHA